MAKERGVFQMIFKSFTASFRRAPKPVYMGKDYNGTKYFEQQKKQDGSHKSSHRYFVPKEKEDFQQDIPAEWESWLRHRRKLPPAVEEVNKNYQIMMQTKENADKLHQAYLESKPEMAKQKQKLGSYPVYEEYENDGQNYKVKVPK